MLGIGEGGGIDDFPRNCFVSQVVYKLEFDTKSRRRRVPIPHLEFDAKRRKTHQKKIKPCQSSYSGHIFVVFFYSYQYRYSGHIFVVFFTHISIGKQGTCFCFFYSYQYRYTGHIFLLLFFLLISMGEHRYGYLVKKNFFTTNQLSIWRQNRGLLVLQNQLAIKSKKRHSLLKFQLCICYHFEKLKLYISIQV